MGESEKPFAYSARVVDEVGNLEFYVAQSLTNLVYNVKNSSDPNRTTIHAWFDPLNNQAIPQESYSKIQVEAPSRDAALAEVETVRTSLENKIIENRELGIDNPIDFGVPKWYKLGAPLEEQIKAYIDTNKKETRVWLSREEIEAIYEA